VRVLSLVSNVVFRDVLTRELFSILSSTNERERYLAFNLLRTVEEETLIKDLLNAITNEKNSVKVRESSIKALRAFPGTDEILRKSAMDVLKGVIDESQIPTLREAGVSVLGEIGEGEPEVAEYLKKRGENKKENDKLRLMALVQLGRTQQYFSVSLVALINLFIDISNPLSDPLNIPNSFVVDLLMEKQESLSEEQLENHKIVVREFIRLDILDIGLKFRFSETLISLDDSPETKELLRTAWANPAEDIGRYVAELREESLSDDNYPAFEFLRTEIGKRKVIKNTTIALEEIETIIGESDKIGEFEKKYPNQREISENLDNFLNSYKNMQKTLKN